MPPIGRACVSKSCEAFRALPPTGNRLPIWGLQKSPYPPSESPETSSISTKACKPELASLPDKDRHYLRNKHVIPMVRDGLLKFRCYALDNGLAEMDVWQPRLRSFAENRANALLADHERVREASGVRTVRGRATVPYCWSTSSALLSCCLPLDSEARPLLPYHCKRTFQL